MFSNYQEKFSVSYTFTNCLWMHPPVPNISQNVYTSFLSSHIPTWFPLDFSRVTEFSVFSFCTVSFHPKPLFLIMPNHTKVPKASDLILEVITSTRRGQHCTPISKHLLDSSTTMSSKFSDSTHAKMNSSTLKSFH